MNGRPEQRNRRECQLARREERSTISRRALFGSRSPEQHRCLASPDEVHQARAEPCDLTCCSESAETIAALQKRSVPCTPASFSSSATEALLARVRWLGRLHRRRVVCRWA